MQLPELRQQLTSAREQLLAAIAGVTEEQLKRRPAPGSGGEAEWCIAEVLAHLLYSERMQAERIDAAIRQDGATITPPAPDAGIEAARAGRISPVPQLIHGLLAVRRQIETSLDGTDLASGILQRGINHPLQGRQTIEYMLQERVLAHELEHIAQIESLKQAMQS
jgi:hypothetical protein